MKKHVALLLCAALLAGLLAGCTSDYPVVDRKLDLAAVLNRCFEGTGYSVQVEEAPVIVSAVADRMSVDMDQSESTITAVREAIRNSSVGAENDLVATWKGDIDISPVIVSCLEDIPGLDVQSYFSGITVHAELTFTNDNIYMLRFSDSAVESARSQMLDAGAACTKGYLSSNSSPVVKIVGGALSDSAIKEIISYVVNFAEVMLKSGAAGYYALSGDDVVTLDDSNRLTYQIKARTLTFTDGTADGLTQTLIGASFTK